MAGRGANVSPGTCRTGEGRVGCRDQQSGYCVPLTGTYYSVEIPKIPLNLTLLKGCSIVGVFWGDFTRREPQRFAEAMRRLGQWYAEGKLKPHVSETFPLERAADALTLMANRQVIGKVVLTV